MSQSEEGKYTIALFCGIKVTPTLSQEIFHSKTWEQAKVEWLSNENGLRDLHHENGRFIGYQYTNRAISLDEMNGIKQDITSQIQKHCSNIDLTKAKLHILSQLLIG